MSILDLLQFIGYELARNNINGEVRIISKELHEAVAKSPDLHKLLATQIGWTSFVFHTPLGKISIESGK